MFYTPHLLVKYPLGHKCYIKCIISKDNIPHCKFTSFYIMFDLQPLSVKISSNAVGNILGYYIV